MMLHYVISCYIIVYRVLLLCYIYILSYVVLFIMVCHIISYCVIQLCHMVAYHIVQHTLYMIKRVLEFRFIPAQKFATKSAMRRSWRQKPQWWKWTKRLPKIPTNLEGERNYHIFVGFRFRGGFFFSTWNDRWTKTKKTTSPNKQVTRFVGRFLHNNDSFCVSTFVRLIQNTAGGGGVPPMTKGWISAMIQTVKNSSGGFYAQWVQPGFCPIFFIQKQSMAEIFKSLPQNMVVSCDLRATFFFSSEIPSISLFEVGNFWDPAFWGKTRFLKLDWDPREFKHRSVKSIRRQKLAKVLPRASPKSSRKKSLLGKETSMTWCAAVLLDEVWKSGSCWENPCSCLCFLMVPSC